MKPRGERDLPSGARTARSPRSAPFAEGGSRHQESCLPVFAHLSDLHATSPRWEGLAEGSAKRALGRLSWSWVRRHEHRSEVLGALLEDLHETAPDHILVTGDITNQGLASELRAGHQFLEELGGSDKVFVVPGNHDVYIEGSKEAVRASWGAFLTSPGDADQPIPVRVVGETALVGLCSAVPTPAAYANGRLGPATLEHLETLLEDLESRGFQRVLLMHHPPWQTGIHPRRALDDAAEFAALIRRKGAELILHGHTHKLGFTELEGPGGDSVPVVGVPSSSAIGQKGPERRARYHLLTPRGEGGFDLRSRVLDDTHRRFVEGETRVVASVESG